MNPLRNSLFVGEPRVVGSRVELRSGREAKAYSIVLLVEDDVLVRMLIADELRNAGYAVVEAADADEALNVLGCNVGVKVVLSDVQMPGSMNGAEFAQVVRSAYPTMKVLLTSGHNGMLDGVEHDGFFPKPCDVEQIVKRIEALID
jgi:two-component system, response regulator PdtaR